MDLDRLEDAAGEVGIDVGHRAGFLEVSTSTTSMLPAPSVNGPASARGLGGHARRDVRGARAAVAVALLSIGPVAADIDE